MVSRSPTLRQRATELEEQRQALVLHNRERRRVKRMLLHMIKDLSAARDAAIINRLISTVGYYQRMACKVD
jgi:uncharacterized protein YigA (DUF484 family)